jgi:hypothetical protein
VILAFLAMLCNEVGISSSDITPSIEEQNQRVCCAVNSNNDDHSQKQLADLFTQISEEYNAGFVIESRLKPRRISFRTYMSLSEGLDFEELLTQQEIQAMDHFARRYKTKNSKRLKHL